MKNANNEDYTNKDYSNDPNTERTKASKQIGNVWNAIPKKAKILTESALALSVGSIMTYNNIFNKPLTVQTPKEEVANVMKEAEYVNQAQEIIAKNGLCVEKGLDNDGKAVEKPIEDCKKDKGATIIRLLREGKPIPGIAEVAKEKPAPKEKTTEETLKAARKELAKIQKDYYATQNAGERATLQKAADDLRAKYPELKPPAKSK